MAVIPNGTRFEAIPTNTKINLRSAQVNDADPSYTIEDLAGTIGTATQGPAGPAGATGATGQTGPQGNPGAVGAVGPAGLQWQGTFVPGFNYVLNDAVAYNGASWFCIVNTNGTTPPDLDTTHWALLAS